MPQPGSVASSKLSACKQVNQGQTQQARVFLQVRCSGQECGACDLTGVTRWLALEPSPAGRTVLLGLWGMWVLFSDSSLADMLPPFL